MADTPSLSSKLVKSSSPFKGGSWKKGNGTSKANLRRPTKVADTSKKDGGDIFDIVRNPNGEHSETDVNGTSANSDNVEKETGDGINSSPLSTEHKKDDDDEAEEDTQTQSRISRKRPWH